MYPGAMVDHDHQTCRVRGLQSGAHYPSDVAAGAALGLVSAWLVRHFSGWCGVCHGDRS
ncbi:hypothetical protein [Streptomyces sp. NPDC046870]|uniref:hypothetical protein n=1 Tax=Streptomyces sp. NPDC046870 TaxID=3155135 RepID=UPI00345525C1